jgi:hypothetical protein
MRLPLPERRGPRALACFILFVFAAAAPSRAQSGDVNFPTPIFSNVVTGAIVPRDVGDPRRTRHFYVFRGTEGDLSVRLVGTNLNGSVDVFSARTLRPLLTITLIPGTTTDATKAVYLREEELLVLRVEARAVGDSEGSYRITLGGTFAPAPAGLAEAPAPVLPQVSPEGQRGGGVRRVTSTGARVEEPPPAREEARAEAPATDARGGEAEEAARPAAPVTPARRSNTRRGNRGATNAARNRGRTPAGTQPTEEAKPAAEAEVTSPTADAAGRSAGEAPAATAEPAPPARRNRGRNARNTRRAANEGASPAAADETNPAAAPAVAPQRLVIMMRGGETIEHEMNSVRRVTVENNQLIVTTKDGKTHRRPMTVVLRVTIEPAPQP